MNLSSLRSMMMVSKKEGQNDRKCTCEENQESARNGDSGDGANKQFTTNGVINIFTFRFSH
jgi:hypothetical protein